MGKDNNPPSLHRYLYAYANPTVYIDPTGHVPVLDEWGQFHTDTAGELIDEAESTDSVTAAIGLGVMAGANYVVGGVVETVNFGLNIVGSEGWLGEGAKERATTELHQAFDTINTIVEDPKGTGTAIVTGVKETAKAAARGETKAIAQSAAVGTSLLVARPNASVGSTVAGVSNTAKNLAVRTGTAMRNTAKAVTQAAEEGRFNPLNYQLEAGTLGMNGGPLKFRGGVNAAGKTALTSTEAMSSRLGRLGYDDANTTRIMQSIENGEQIVIVGENMKRVNAVASMVDKAGGQSVTYAPRRWNGMSRNSLEANRSWIRYWAKDKGATVIDIGRQSTPRPFGPSPFYGIENRSLNRWGIYTPFKQ